MFKFSVAGQRLACAYSHTVAGTINYLSAEVSFEASVRFSEDWAGLDKWLHFAKGDEVYDFQLIDDAVTADRGLDLPDGIWEAYIHGTKVDDQGNVVQRITTSTITINVYPTGELEGGPLPPVNPTDSEQIAAVASDARRIAQEAKVEMEEAIRVINVKLDRILAEREE